MKHDEIKGGSIKNMHFHPGFVVCSNVMDVISQNSSADEMEEWNKMYGEILVTVSNLNRLFCFDSNGVRILLKEAVELGNTDAILRLIDVAGEDIWDHRFGAEMDTLGVARLSRKENIDDIIKYSLLAAENGLDKNASTKVMRELIKSELALMEPQSGISIRHPSGYIPPDIEEVILLLNALLKIEPQDDYALEKLFDLRFSSREYQMAKTLIDNNPQKNAWFKNYINNEIEALMEKTKGDVSEDSRFDFMRRDSRVRVFIAGNDGTFIGRRESRNSMAEIKESQKAAVAKLKTIYEHFDSVL